MPDICEAPMFQLWDSWTENLTNMNFNFGLFFDCILDEDYCPTIESLGWAQRQLALMFQWLYIGIPGYEPHFNIFRGPQPAEPRYTPVFTFQLQRLTSSIRKRGRTERIDLTNGGRLMIKFLLKIWSDMPVTSQDPAADKRDMLLKLLWLAAIQHRLVGENLGGRAGPLDLSTYKGLHELAMEGAVTSENLATNILAGPDMSDFVKQEGN